MSLLGFDRQIQKFKYSESIAVHWRKSGWGWRSWGESVYLCVLRKIFEYVWQGVLYFCIIWHVKHAKRDEKRDVGSGGVKLWKYCIMYRGNCAAFLFSILIAVHCSCEPGPYPGGSNQFKTAGIFDFWVLSSFAIDFVSDTHDGLTIKTISLIINHPGYQSLYACFVNNCNT